MGCSCGLSYLEDDLEPIDIFYFDKATPFGITAWEITFAFINIWAKDSVLYEIDEEDEDTHYFTVEQVLSLKNNPSITPIIDWEWLENFLRVSPAKNKRFCFWYSC